MCGLRKIAQFFGKFGHLTLPDPLNYINFVTQPDPTHGSTRPVSISAPDPAPHGELGMAPAPYLHCRARSDVTSIMVYALETARTLHARRLVDYQN